MRLHLAAASFVDAQRAREEAKAKGQAVLVVRVGWWLWSRWQVWVDVP